MSYQLRPYQQQSINEARQAFIEGHRKVILMLPTGAGKSIVIRKILEMAKGRTLFVVHRKILIKQMKEVLKGLDVDIKTLQMAGRNKTDYYDLIIHDECHYSWTSKLRNNLNSKFYLGLSATPTSSDGIPLECDKLISFMQMPDLIEQGFAVPFKVLSTSKVETKLLKSSGGDYNQKQSYDLMAKSEIKKDILDTYFRHCHGLNTLVYAVNILHAEELHKEFLEAGVDNEVIHSKKDTEDIIDRFKEGKVKVLINVSILTIGFDYGDLECLLLAAPTKSVVLAQQIYGRVSRLPVKSNKKFGLIIDCANVIQDSCHPMKRIDMNKKKQDKKQKKCKCGESMMILDKKITPIDDYSYTQLTYYRCDFCNLAETNEEIKAINFAFCEGCGVVLEGGDIKYKQSDNAIEFTSSCQKCGNEATVREILLSDKELKEIKHEEVMKTSSWEKVEIMLKAECKKWKHHHKYSTHLIVGMKAKGKTPEEVENYILNIRENNQKISSLQFKG